MWSFPIIRHGLVYVVDIRNGLYVLRYRGPFAQELRCRTFSEGNSTVGRPVRRVLRTSVCDGSKRIARR